MFKVDIEDHFAAGRNVNCFTEIVFFKPYNFFDFKN
jgi:hypothetical protein